MGWPIFFSVDKQILPTLIFLLPPFDKLFIWPHFASLPNTDVFLSLQKITGGEKREDEKYICVSQAKFFKGPWKLDSYYTCSYLDPEVTHP